MNLANRRIRNGGLTLLVMAGMAWWVRAQEQSLDPTAFTTGYLLLAALVFLALYNVRKKMPFLPLGSSTTWLQWHLYVGVGTLGVFALHIGPNRPRGIFDTTLAVVYLLTAVSGMVGLYFTRTIPAQLTRLGVEVVYERIPAFRRQVWQQASSVVLQGVAASGATTLADFYVARLYDFFGRPRGIRYFCKPTFARRRALLREMRDLRRYLSEPEQSACERLFALVRRKDDLDFHHARQKLLKLWLFLHIGLTWWLLLLALVHGLLAHAFYGGAV